MTSRRSRALLILVLGAAALTAVGAGLPAPVRFAITFPYVAVCPGLAWVALLRLRDGLAEWVLGVALSLITATLLSESLVLLRMWSPTAILVVLVVATVPACGRVLMADPVPRVDADAA